MMSQKLQDCLRRLDPALADTAETLWRLARPIHDRQNSPDSNENGYEHASHVEANTWRLIREANREGDFQAHDLFLLSCGACCHDFDKGLKSALQGDPAHGDGSPQYVESGPFNILLSGPVRSAICDIISLHDLKVKEFRERIAGIDDKYPIEDKTVNLQRLAVLLKAGDILHTDASRVLRIGVDIANLPERERAKYHARACISGWKVEGAKIVLLAQPRNDEQTTAVCEAHRFMCDHEWSAVEQWLDNMHFPHLLYLTVRRQGAPDVHYPPTPPTPSNLQQISEPVRDFVGRSGEIEKLLAAFEGAGQGAVISGVRGMGGVGKTELAKVLAKRLKKRFPDGQISFNLRGASDDASSKPATPVEALQHVIRSFHPEALLPEDVEPLKSLYHSVLEGKRVLLLMDNALNAQQLAPLAPPPDGCALMVTSRHSISIAGMKTVDLNMLSADEARKLLLEICPRIGGHADALAERCGHLPLALRLAASSLETHGSLEVDDYVKRLANERQRLVELDKDKKMVAVDIGINASLAISYRLLDKRLQRYWRALAVFPGDFETAAAADVCHLKGEEDASRVLGDLYAASMVLWDEATGRFRLHDLARDYARAQLSNKERAGDAQHHAAHYAGVLRRTDELYLEGGDAILQGLALFDREWHNVREGQAWAATHWQADNTAANLCSDYPDAGVYCLSLRLHSRTWIAWLEAALEAARKLKDRAVEGYHLGNLGNAYADLGETRKAIEYHEKRIVIAREIGDRRGEGNALGNLGIAYRDLGEPRKAIEYYEKHIVIAREIGDRRGEGQALGNLGIAHAVLGETRKAIEFYEQHLAVAREIGDRLGEGAALGNLGIAFKNLGEPRKAIEYYEQALVIDREIGDRRGEGQDLGNLGNAYAALGETPEAIEYYEQQLAIDREIGDRLGEGIVLHNLADALAKTGRRDEAIAHAAQAVEIFEQIESPHAAKARAQLEELRK